MHLNIIGDTTQLQSPSNQGYSSHTDAMGCEGFQPPGQGSGVRLGLQLRLCRVVMSTWSLSVHKLSFHLCQAETVWPLLGENF